MIPYSSEVKCAILALVVYWTYDSVLFYFTSLWLIFALVDYYIIILPEKKLNPISQNKYILITGCSSGIGRSTALYLNKIGYSIIGTVRKIEDGESLSKEAAKPESIKYVILDISSDESVDKAFKNVQEIIGKENQLLALFNNSGIGYENLTGAEDWSNSFLYATESAMRRVLDINFFGTLRVTKKFWPLLTHPESTVIFNTSVAGFWSPPFMGAYTASKGALERFCDSLRRERGPADPRIVILQCGMVKTTIIDKGHQLLQSNSKTELNSTLKAEKEFYDYMQRMMNTMGENPQIAAQLIERAIRSKAPLTRYTTGGMSLNSYLMAYFMPDWVTDYSLPKLIPLVNKML